MQQAGSYTPAEAGGPFRRRRRKRKRSKMEKTKRSVVIKTAETKKKKFLKKKIKKKGTLTTSKWMAQEKDGFFIPGDIVSEILLRLPARSLGKFRCVSKSWLSITSHAAFVRSNAQRNHIACHSLIMLQPTKFVLALPEANSESAVRLHLLQPMKSMPDASDILASCDGLVCVGTFLGLQYHIINPLTAQSIALPIDGVNLNPSLGFYFHRSTSKYRLIRFKDTGHENEVLVVGESSWRRISASQPAFFHGPQPVDLNGNLYWLARSRNELRSEDPPDTVVIFDEEEEVYSAISLPPLEKFHDLGGNLIDFNGELGLWVVSKENTIDVWIMASRWIKRHSFNYAHILRNPSRFPPLWILGGAITFGDEELLVNTSNGDRVDGEA